MSNIKDLNNEEELSQDLTKFDSAVTCITVGELQQYIAVGTNRGHVNIYESHNIHSSSIFFIK